MNSRFGLRKFSSVFFMSEQKNIHVRNRRDSDYHLYGIPNNSRENSNGTVHSGGNFPENSNNSRGIERL